MNIQTTLEDIQKMSKTYNFLPVYAKIVGDMETPVSLFEKLIADDIGFLLESAESNKNFGRYSFLGFNPLFELTAYKDKTVVDYNTGEQKIVIKAPIEAMKEVFSQYKAPDIPSMPPFFGGMIGYLTYDTVATFEKVRGMDISSDDKLVQMLLCQDIVVMDHLTHSLYLVTWKEAIDNEEILYSTACQRLKKIFDKIKSTLSDKPKSIEKCAKTYLYKPKKQDYCQNVLKIKDYIASGDTYQTVISEPFESPLLSSPFTLYRKLRRVNPSPYMFYLNFGNKKIVGASPEMLVKVLNKTVTTFPIAGTRRRGKDSQEDAFLAKDLLEDKKELAEHSMLVDLGRNDLGRVCTPGSVKVTRLKEIEYFSHVMHIVSQVTGSLADDKDVFDVLKACFPAGTVSGAPKIRAMEIIAQLEKIKRGVYAGAVGYFDFNGNLDTCIAIRTMSIDEGVVTVRAGAGIVADSIAENEWQEVLQKTMVLRNLLEEEENATDNY